MNSIDYMGLKLNNPIMVSAGSFTANASLIQKAIDAGASVVTTRTISLEKSSLLSPRFYKNKGEFLNITKSSNLDLDEWENEFGKINKKGSYVFANITATTTSEFIYVAKKVERYGADGIEICPFTPIGAKNEKMYYNPDVLSDLLKEVVCCVDIPVCVRLPHNLACTKPFVRAIESAGVKAINTIETFKALWGVDIETSKSKVATYGGYSGEHLLPITLATIATLAQETNIQLSAMGGIQSWQNIIECIMLGATTVSLGSIIIDQGYEVITKMRNCIDDYCNDKKIDDLMSIKGKALKSLKNYEDIVSKEKKAIFIGSQDSISENKEIINNCITSCLVKAIGMDGKKIEINQKTCNGCGLCNNLAPKLFAIE